MTHEPGQRSARVLAFCNQKGGVGKTTTVFHLARALIRRGLHVLIVDDDDQGNITTVAVREPLAETAVGLADVLSRQTSETARDVIVPGIWEGLDVLPTPGEALSSVRDELVVGGTGREARLRQALAPVLTEYDVILIDCGPSLDLLTVNALTAADAAVIITHTELFSANGLARLLTTIEDVRAYYNEQLTIAGAIVNQHEAQTRTGQDWLETITNALTDQGVPVMSPPVPKRVAIGDSMKAATPLDEWEARGLADLIEQYDEYAKTLTETA